MGVDLSKSDPQTDPLIGRTLDGRYEVLGRLGEGGVGVVYRGRQTHLGRFVAIKVLHQDAAGIPEWRRRFEREAKALSALAHPNVVPVTDFGIDGGVPFLVMELLQGKTLGDLIKEGPLPLGRTLDIARQTLRGLAFAHGKGIVHRDLKPANVFLQELPDQADHVRLLDFGMAKFLEGSGSRTVPENLTRAGIVFGTPAYMSPEQVKAGAVDARSDVYAAGILLFELLAGRRPFLADSYEGYLGAHLTQPVPSLAKLRPRIPAARLFQTLIERAMAKKPADRFEDAGALLAGLEAVMARRQVVAAVGRRRRRARQADARRAQRSAVGLALGAPRGRGRDAGGGDRRRGGVSSGMTGRHRSRPRRRPRSRRPRPRRPPAAAAQTGSAARRLASPVGSPSSELPAPQPPRGPRRPVRPPKPPAHAENEAPRSSRQQPETEREARLERPQSLEGAGPPRAAADPRPHRSRARTCPSGRWPPCTNSRTAIPAIPAPGFCSDTPTPSSTGTATLSTGTSGPTTSIQPAGATRRCSPICSRPPRIRSPPAPPRAPSATSTAPRRSPRVDKAMKSSAGDRDAIARLARLRESLSH